MQTLIPLLLPLLLLGAEGAPRPTRDSGDISETSGDELSEAPREHPSHPSAKLESLSRGLAMEITSLRNEHFADEWPKDSMDSYKDYKLAVPHLVDADGCFSNNFSKKRCLNGIVNKLEQYESCLKFVEREWSRPTKVARLILRTHTLVRSVADKMKSAKVEKLEWKSPEIVLDESAMKTDWERKITAHVILREFGVFMMETYRAIRHINQRSTT